MSKIRRNFALTEDDYMKLKEIQQERQIPSLSATLSLVIQKFIEQDMQGQNVYILSKLIKQELEPMLKKLLLQASESEKNSRILLDMMNDISITNNWDTSNVNEGRFIDNMPSILYQDAYQRYEQRIKETIRNQDLL